MIIHQYPDNSSWYEYEHGDRVSIIRTICTGWLSDIALQSGVGIVRKIWASKYYPHRKALEWVTPRAALLEVEHSTAWGLTQCYPWMLLPLKETLTSAKLLIEQ